MQFHATEPQANLLYGSFRDTDTLIYRYRTGCCSLGQLSLGNNHEIEHIKAALDLVKAESKKSLSTYGRDGGERAMFVAVMESEGELRNNLIKLGFTKMAEIPRRVCYAEGKIELWLIVL